MTETLWFAAPSEFERVRRLNISEVERAALFADLCRLNTLSMIAYAGSGHIGSSFSSLDIVTWLFLHELGKTANGSAPDLYYSSKGHDAPGLYAAMIALGRLSADNSRKLRRLGGLPGHPDIVSTPEIVTNTGSLGMGISKAKGMVFADKLQGRRRRIFILTGDGELQEGQIWESLLSAANYGIDNIIAIVDHNKLQSDIWVSETSDLGDLEAKFAAFGWHVARCDGHDIQALADTIDAVEAVKGKPKVIIADTVKGRGISFMESTALGPNDKLYRYHSGAPSADDYARGAKELIERINGKLQAVGSDALALEEETRPVKPIPAVPQRMVPAYTEALIAAAAKDKRIVALDGDLVLDTGLIPFRDRFPDRFLECGIAEQDMVSQAGGMALQGLVPLVHSFACFLAARPVEQIYNNASERTKVIYVGSLAGAVPGGPGHSHQSVNDIATLGAMPGIELVEPSCPAEVAPLLDYLLAAEGSGYLRLVSIPCDIPYSLPAGYRAVPGVGVELLAGKDAVIVGYGPVLLPQAWYAAKILRDKHGLDVGVVNLPWLSQVDCDWLRKTVEGKRAVFTLDNHLLKGGQGRMVAAAISELGLKSPPVVKSLGLTDFPVCGQDAEVLRAHGLDADSLAETMAAALRGRA